MGQIYFPMDHTPEEWRAMARVCYRREQESFDRSDTDGFLSQWANAVAGRLYDQLAEVAEAGGVWTFTVLANAAGTVIEGAREVQTRYGWAWVTPDGQWFNPSRARDEDTSRGPESGQRLPAGPSRTAGRGHHGGRRAMGVLPRGTSETYVIQAPGRFTPTGALDTVP